MKRGHYRTSASKNTSQDGQYDSCVRERVNLTTRARFFLTIARSVSGSETPQETIDLRP